MSIVKLEEIKDIAIKNGNERSKQRLMALDLGTKTIGVAISNPEWTMAFPVETIKRVKLQPDLERLSALAKEWDTSIFILGLPLNMDGTEGPRCQATRAFADNLLKHADLFEEEPMITFQDERLSTFAAEDLLINDLDMKRKKRKAVIDQMAAVQILKSALERLR